MRLLLLASAVLVAAVPAVAVSATAPPLIRVAKPSFPAPHAAVAPSGSVRLATVSTTSRGPTYTPPRDPLITGEAVRELGGATPTRAFPQPGTTLVLYGTGVVVAYGPQGGLKYAFDVRSSPSLVANADNFLVARGLIVSGYGFTAEQDWLYLVDPADGRVRDRLALPFMAERLSLRDGQIVVRAYDVVARLRDVG